MLEENWREFWIQIFQGLPPFRRIPHKNVFDFDICLSFSRHALQQMNIPAHSRPRRIDAAVEYVTRAQSTSHWKNFAVDESNKKWNKK